MGCDAPRTRALASEHLLSAPVRPRLLRASPRAGDPDPAVVRPDHESDPLLQRAVSAVLRLVRARNVSARARADRQPHRGIRRRRRVCLRTVPILESVAPAGAVVGVDAVRVVRSAALFRNRPRAGAGWRRRRLAAPESFLRLLSPVFQSDRTALRVLGTDDEAPMDRCEDADARHRSRRLRRGRDSYVPRTLSEAA